MSASAETSSEREPDASDATISLSLSLSHSLTPSHTQWPTHTHTRLNMKPDVSPGKTAMYAFDLGMVSEIGKCKAP